jgi:hypothetical protein
MRHALLAVLLAASLAPAVHAQESAADVTEGQVLDYQQGVANGCRAAGLRSGDAPAAVDAFCSCLVKTLADSMSVADWQQAYFYSRAQRDSDEVRVLKAHAGKVAACRVPPPAAAPTLRSAGAGQSPVRLVASGGVASLLR